MTLVRFSISAWLASLVSLVSAACCVAALGSLGGCGYDDRDYGGVVFACDAQHPCPDNGPCVDGKCQPGNGSGGGSAQQGVSCGSQLCPLGMSCCADFNGLARCAAAGCGGTQDIELQCDGREDCSGGRACCLSGIDTACGGSCPGTTVCSTAADCTGNDRFCCDLGAFPFPLKLCQPVAC